jgi:hypothetical protein
MVRPRTQSLPQRLPGREQLVPHNRVALAARHAAGVGQKHLDNVVAFLDSTGLVRLVGLARGDEESRGHESSRPGLRLARIRLRDGLLMIGLLDGSTTRRSTLVGTLAAAGLPSARRAF